jgi:hypothetical protein
MPDKGMQEKIELNQEVAKPLAEKHTPMMQQHMY